MGQRGRPRHPDVLTPREQDVLSLIREGLTNEQIAARLGITFETAKHHVSEILSKLGVETREDAAAWQDGHTGRRLLAGLAAVGTIGIAVAMLVLLLGSRSDKTSDEVEEVTASPRPTSSVTEAPTSTPTSAFGEKVPVTGQTIHVIDKDGHSDVVLAPGFDTAWSPDGNNIAFVGHWTGPGLGGQNWVDLIAAGGGPLREIGSYGWDDLGGPCSSLIGSSSWLDELRLLIRSDTSGVGSVIDIGNGYSRTALGCDDDIASDGRTFYTGLCDGSQNSCVRVVEGEHNTQLAEGLSFAFSPDERSLAIVDYDSRVRLLDLETSESSTIATLGSIGSITWSPDGRQLLTITGSIIDVDTGDISELWPSEVYSAEWSPDGTRIAYYVQPSGTCSGIEIMSVTDESEIAFIPYAYHIFDWSPTGEFLAYSSNDNATVDASCETLANYR